MKHHKFGRDPKIQFSNSCPYVFYKQAALKHIVKFLGKHLGWSPIFSERQETWSDNLNWKKIPHYRCFPVNNGKFSMKKQIHGK